MLEQEKFSKQNDEFIFQFAAPYSANETGLLT